MGFKTTNFYSEHLDIEFSEAYAMIKELHIEGKSGVAVFAIQTSRDKSMFAKPIETVKVYFEVDRNENPYITAYKRAKESHEVFDINPLNGKYEKVEKAGVFASWEDDIITG